MAASLIVKVMCLPARMAAATALLTPRPSASISISTDSTDLRRSVPLKRCRLYSAHVDSTTAQTSAISGNATSR